MRIFLQNRFSFLEQLVGLTYKGLSQFETQHSGIEPVEISTFVLSLFDQSIEKFVFVSAVVAKNKLLTSFVKNQLSFSFFHYQYNSTPGPRDNLPINCHGDCILYRPNGNLLKAENAFFSLKYAKIDNSEIATTVLSANNTLTFTKWPRMFAVCTEISANLFRVRIYRDWLRIGMKNSIPSMYWDSTSPRC